MYHFKYVSKNAAAPFKNELIKFIKSVQNSVRDDFTFQFTFIGSSSRNMITYDPETNIGFDFDVNITVNVEDENYTAEEIRTVLFNAFRKNMCNYGYNKCEQSTRVITVKKISYGFSRIEYSCDFAVVYEGHAGQHYIRYNKRNNNYSWEYQEQPYSELEKYADRLRENGYWEEVRNIYLKKKNNNTNPDKHSRSLYAEAVNECYGRHFNQTNAFQPLQKKQTDEIMNNWLCSSRSKTAARLSGGKSVK